MRFSLFLFLLISRMTVTGQLLSVSSPLVLTHITEENGLSDNHVTAVYKDREELLWVGTKDGLNLLDGSSITIFKNDPGDSNSISNNYISGIAEDRQGKVWIGTANGLCMYDKHKRKFSVLLYYGQDKKTIGSISNIAVSSNSLWFGATGGLFEYKIAEKKISCYFNNSNQFETNARYSNKINHVLVAADGKIWLSTADGLWNFLPGTSTFNKIIHKQNDPSYHPLCLYVFEDHEKNIWAGFWNTGLKKYEPFTGRLTDFGGQLNHLYTISSIREVKQSDDKINIWLNGKLFAFNEKENRFFSFQQPIGEKEFPEVMPAYQSADGWLWLTSDNGLYAFNPQNQIFTHQLFNGLITTQSVVFSNYKGGVLVGGQGNDFLKWKTTNGRLLKDYSSLCEKSTAMLSILQNGANDFWIGTADGILHTNLETGYKKWYRHSDSDSTSIPRDFIAKLFIDSHKNLWLFPWREGIWQMDMHTGKCKKMLDGFITESGKTKKLLISDALEDPAGNIWMADLDEGIVLYDTHINRFSKPFEKQIGLRASTAKLYIRNGKIYSALTNAIIMWDPATRELKRFQLPLELNKPITDIHPDNNGNWWLATASGLIVFNESNNSFHRFTVADGLYQNDISGTLFCAADNTMLVGSPSYFSAFKPAQLNNLSATKKNILLTGFFANNKAVDLSNTKNISLRYAENNIVITWALPAYGNPLKNRYFCQLQGIDSGWRYIGNKGEVQYANLSSGRYTILLKAASSNETESKNIIHVSFTIHPPFWKTTWFIILSILILSILFFTVVRYISQRNLKEKLLQLEKEQAIEKERNRISKDMHDDLGSGLTKIAILSEVVKKQMNDPEKAKVQLDNISASSRELVDNLQDIIWILNPKNDTLENMAAYIREYGLKFFEPFSITMLFAYPDKFSSLKFSEETRRNTFLVIKETFNNIAKHAWCNKVKVTIEQAPSSITIKIEDDGKGFDTENVRPFGNGLANMKNRMLQVNGTYKISSEKEKGTVTILQINT